MKHSAITLLFIGISAVLTAITFTNHDPVAAAPVPIGYLPFVKGPGNPATETIPFDVERSGNATYYWEADGSGNCLFDSLPEPQYVAAMNRQDYNSPQINGQNFPTATMCGAFAEVTGRKGTIIVQIVDQCPDAGCVRGHLDLSPEAFAEIDDIPLGFVPITWQFVSPPMDGPIKFRYKDGSSQWWTAVQIQNHRNPIATVEVQKGGNWVNLERQDWNYFLDSSGFGQGFHTFRVTDVFGNQLIETSKVNLDQFDPNTVDWTGDGQFPPPP
ncbi:MAG: expansin EXLX1 family cellulose-binding protein [Ardenticatenaceae bacterium]|nr:expansin EXLX1 family cellulose-binding protein [Ardenticatenaceae bacterium]